MPVPTPPRSPPAIHILRCTAATTSQTTTPAAPCPQSHPLLHSLDRLCSSNTSSTSASPLTNNSSSALNPPHPCTSKSATITTTTSHYNSRSLSLLQSSSTGIHQSHLTEDSLSSLAQGVSLTLSPSTATSFPRPVAKAGYYTTQPDQPNPRPFAHPPVVHSDSDHTAHQSHCDIGHSPVGDYSTLHHHNKGGYSNTSHHNIHSRSSPVLRCPSQPCSPLTSSRSHRGLLSDSFSDDHHTTEIQISAVDNKNKNSSPDPSVPVDPSTPSLGHQATIMPTPNAFLGALKASVFAGSTSSAADPLPSTASLLPSSSSSARPLPAHAAQLQSSHSFQLDYSSVQHSPQLQSSQPLQSNALPYYSRSQTRPSSVSQSHQDPSQSHHHTRPQGGHPGPDPEVMEFLSKIGQIIAKARTTTPLLSVAASTSASASATPGLPAEPLSGFQSDTQKQLSNLEKVLLDMDLWRNNIPVHLNILHSAQHVLLERWVISFTPPTPPSQPPSGITSPATTSAPLSPKDGASDIKSRSTHSSMETLQGASYTGYLSPRSMHQHSDSPRSPSSGSSTASRKDTTDLVLLLQSLYTQIRSLPLHNCLTYFDEQAKLTKADLAYSITSAHEDITVPKQENTLQYENEHTMAGLGAVDSDSYASEDAYNGLTLSLRSTLPVEFVQAASLKVINFEASHMKWGCIRVTGMYDESVGGRVDPKAIQQSTIMVHKKKSHRSKGTSANLPPSIAALIARKQQLQQQQQQQQQQGAAKRTVRLEGDSTPPLNHPTSQPVGSSLEQSRVGPTEQMTTDGSNKMMARPTSASSQDLSMPDTLGSASLDEQLGNRLWSLKRSSERLFSSLTSTTKTIQSPILSSNNDLASNHSLPESSTSAEVHTSDPSLETTTREQMSSYKIPPPSPPLSIPLPKKDAAKEHHDGRSLARIPGSSSQTTIVPGSLAPNQAPTDADTISIPYPHYDNALQFSPPAFVQQHQYYSHPPFSTSPLAHVVTRRRSSRLSIVMSCNDDSPDPAQHSPRQESQGSPQGARATEPVFGSYSRGSFTEGGFGMERVQPSPSRSSLLRRGSLNPLSTSLGGGDLFGSLVGSYEESILSGRMSTLPSRPLIFTAQIGVLAHQDYKDCPPKLRCPKHVQFEFPAVFYNYERPAGAGTAAGAGVGASSQSHQHQHSHLHHHSHSSHLHTHAQYLHHPHHPHYPYPYHGTTPHHSVHSRHSHPLGHHSIQPSQSSLGFHSSPRSSSSYLSTSLNPTFGQSTPLSSSLQPTTTATTTATGPWPTSASWTSSHPLSSSSSLLLPPFSLSSVNTASPALSSSLTTSFGSAIMGTGGSTTSSSTAAAAAAAAAAATPLAVSDDHPVLPYVGYLDLDSGFRGSKRFARMPGGMRIPQRGHVQVIIKNPNKTVVKLFLVPYDLTDMPAGTKTFLRQKYYSEGEQGLGGATSSASSGRLRYAIHLQFCCPAPGYIYLYRSIRVVFANRMPDGKESLRVVLEGLGIKARTVLSHGSNRVLSSPLSSSSSMPATTATMATMAAGTAEFESDHPYKVGEERYVKMRKGEVMFVSSKRKNEGRLHHLHSHRLQHHHHHPLHPHRYHDLHEDGDDDDGRVSSRGDGDEDGPAMEMDMDLDMDMNMDMDMDHHQATPASSCSSSISSPAMGMTAYRSPDPRTGSPRVGMTIANAESELGRGGGLGLGLGLGLGFDANASSSTSLDYAHRVPQQSREQQRVRTLTGLEALQSGVATGSGMPHTATVIVATTAASLSACTSSFVGTSGTPSVSSLVAVTGIATSGSAMKPPSLPLPLMQGQQLLAPSGHLGYVVQGQSPGSATTTKTTHGAGGLGLGL